MKAKNPFKIWLSWIGSYSIIPIAQTIFRSDLTITDKLFWFKDIFHSDQYGSIQVTSEVYSILFLMIVGFVIGWIIDGLLRKFKLLGFK